MKRGFALLLQAALLAGAWSAYGRPGASGAELYRIHCAVCHGPEGRGDGPGAALNVPKPRDFATGQFRLVTSPNRVPSREDLLRTITDGVPGTGMPPWGHLPEADRRALADEVLRLSAQGLAGALEAQAKASGEPMKPGEALGIAAKRLEARPPAPLPPMPAATPERIRRGRELYLSTCSSCHGEDARGMRDPLWRTAENENLGSRDLVADRMKGREDPESLYRRIEVGIPGAPMPAYEPQEDPAEIWDIVHYLTSIRRTPPEPRPLAALWLPASANEQGRWIDHDFKLTLAVTGVVGALALGGLVLALGRAVLVKGSPAPYRPGDRRVQAFWIAVPSVIVLAMVANSWVVFRRLTEPLPDALRIRVTGKQFFWTFEYPDYKARSTGLAAVPTGRNLHFEIESGDVIHSFFVPHLKMKRDAVPGLTTHLWVRPVDAPGALPVLCNQLCGNDHALMNATLEALPPSEFESWIQLRRQP